jgi:plasmid stability protein
MARTTLMIDDGLLRQIKRKAADEGRTFQAVTNELLRQALAKPAAKPYHLTWKGWKAELHPGVDISDRNSLFDFMDQE